MTEEKNTEHGSRDFVENILEKGKKLYQNAAHKSNQYKQLVEKRIELTSTNKKINHSLQDLGKLVYRIHETGKKAIFTNEEVKVVMETIQGFKETAAHLEQEIDELREDDVMEEESTQDDKDE